MASITVAVTLLTFTLALTFSPTLALPHSHILLLLLPLLLSVIVHCACRAAKQMDTLTKEVAVPLGVYMKGFPTVQRLHPFEQAMLELTWGTQTYEKVLSKVDSLRKSILQASFLHLLSEGMGRGPQGFDLCGLCICTTQWWYTKAYIMLCLSSCMWSSYVHTGMSHPWCTRLQVRSTTL